MSRPNDDAAAAFNSGPITVTPGTAVFRLTTFAPSVIVTTYEEQMIRKAGKMHGQGEYGLAVIASHIACEIAATRVFSKALATQQLTHLDDPLSDLLNGFNLATERNRNLFNAVTKCDIQNQSFWSSFKVSAALRNEIVHTIRVVKEAESESSVKAATEFVKFLLGADWNG